MMMSAAITPAKRTAVLADRSSNWAGPDPSAAPEVAIALGYDTQAAPQEPDDQ